MSNLEENVNRILARNEAQETAEEARAEAVREAKPEAFAAFEERCVEAAELLVRRGIEAETAKQAVVGYREERRLLSRKVAKVPVTERVAGWILYQGWKTVDRGGASYYNDPSWLAGMMFDTEGRLYRFRDDEAHPLSSFDDAVGALGSTNARTPEHVQELREFWEDKVTQATARIIQGRAPTT